MAISAALCCPESKWEKLDNKRSQYICTHKFIVFYGEWVQETGNELFPLLSSSLLWLVAMLKQDLNWESCLRGCCFILDYVCLSFCIMLRNNFIHTKLITDRNARYKLYAGKIVHWAYMSFHSAFRTSSRFCFSRTVPIWIMKLVLTRPYTKLQNSVDLFPEVNLLHAVNRKTHSGILPSLFHT
jgi:hypothetical protein